VTSNINVEQHQLTSALARTKRAVEGLVEEKERGIIVEEVSEKLGLSRKLTNTYLNELVRLQELEKRPNTDRKLNGRFVYIPKSEKIE